MVNSESEYYLLKNLLNGDLYSTSTRSTSILPPQVIIHKIKYSVKNRQISHIISTFGHLNKYFLLNSIITMIY